MEAGSSLLLCFSWLQRVLPVQREAARTFCAFLRYNRKQEQRREMMERLIQGGSDESRTCRWCEELHSVFSDLQIWLRAGATGTA